MGTVGRVSAFFDAHPKCQRALRDAIEATQPESTKSKLKDVCRTCWIERIDALGIFKDLHPSVVACLAEICSEGRGAWSADSLTDARVLQLVICTTEFLRVLVITEAVLQYLRPLTIRLQTEAKDIIAATEEIDTVLAATDNVSDHIDAHHEAWYVSTVCFMSVKGIISSFRRCTISTST